MYRANRNAFLLFMFLSACSSPAERIVSVRLNPVMEDGSRWDLLGGVPDPYIVVDGKSYRDHACDDSYKCSFRVRGSWWYRIEVFDRDEALDGKAGSAWCLASGTCHAGTAEIRFEEGP